MMQFTFFQDLANAWELTRDQFWTQFGIFVSLTLRGLGLSLLIGIPLGIVLSRMKRVSAPIISALGLLQTIPSLVLLGLCVPYLGIGSTPALFAAVIYSLFPVVQNTYVGISQVSPSVRDAARGMGMTDRQLLMQVDLPLAFPVILAGVRTAAIYAIAMVVIATVIGAGGLGDFVYAGISRGHQGLIWLGAIPVLVVTIVLFCGLGGLARVSERNSTLGLSIGGTLIVLLSTYAVVSLLWNRNRNELLVGGKDFIEGRILAQVLKQTTEAQTDRPVRVVSNLGTGMILKALKTGQLDIYAEYAGNLLTSKDALDMDVPRERDQITAIVQKGMKEKFDLVFMKPFGLNNTYAPCLLPGLAKKLDLKTISDLRRTPELRVVVDQSFLTRPDGWKGLVETYGLKFDTPPTQMDSNMRYTALENHKADLVIGFATDWQIQTMNLTVLADDRGYFPSYHAAPLVREEVLEEYPDVARALRSLGGQIDDSTMRELNYEVASNSRVSVSDVVHAFLQKRGLLEPQVK